MQDKPQVDTDCKDDKDERQRTKNKEQSTRKEQENGKRQVLLSDDNVTIQDFIKDPAGILVFSLIDEWQRDTMGALGELIKGIVIVFVIYGSIMYSINVVTYCDMRMTQNGPVYAQLQFYDAVDEYNEAIETVDGKPTGSIFMNCTTNLTRTFDEFIPNEIQRVKTMVGIE